MYTRDINVMLRIRKVINHYENYGALPVGDALTHDVIQDLAYMLSTPAVVHRCVCVCQVTLVFETLLK